MRHSTPTPLVQGCIALAQLTLAAGCLLQAPSPDEVHTGPLPDAQQGDGGLAMDAAQHDLLRDARTLPDTACVAANTITVDDDWSSLPTGSDVGACRELGKNAFASIGAALAAVPQDGTVHVLPGVYRGAMKLTTKGLRLLGEPGAIIDGDTDKDGTPDVADLVAVNAPNVTVQGFEIRNAEIGLSTSANGITFRDNTVHNITNWSGLGGVGILGWGPLQQLTISNNTVYNTDRQGIYAGHTNAAQISGEITVTGNTVQT